MKDYYIDNLSGNHLQRAYALADAAVTAYLQGEIDYLRECIKPGNRVLELGCGYGRVVKALAADSHSIVGIDNAPGNLKLAREYLRDARNVEVHLMSVASLDFTDQSFDLVVSPQNGLSAFGLNPVSVVREALRVTDRDGTFVCCTYADAFWPSRLAWFRRQADAGLLGEIDEESSGNGVIACKDGFESTAMNRQQFEEIAVKTNTSVTLQELPSGSLIAEFRKSA